MIGCNSDNHKYMECCIIYQGPRSNSFLKDVSPMWAYIKTLHTLKFVDWCPSGCKIGLVYQEPKYYPNSDLATVSRTCFMLANNTAISHVWNRIGTTFDLGFRERAYVHSFVQNGMEEGEFNSAREDLDALEADYDEIMEECYNDGEDNE
ncbi:Alpha-tubulin [Hexamita inflata]|uniref:Alpha-tubulin n=1 Tax=Hexamita inflata TaxID=28002 RepID=A0AA86NH42_9EUKA|nr:Alpha-tubulin [Hexamita inflata]